MEEEAPVPPTPARGARKARGAGLAITSVVLGVLGVFTSFLLVGAFPALAGLVFGVVHLISRRESRGLAWMGVGLALAGLVGTVGFGVLYLVGMRQSMQQGPPMPVAMRAGEQGGWIGRQAPELELVAIDGTRWRLSELRGRRVVLDFWATWCPPCVEEVPHFVKLRESLSTNDVMVLGVSWEDRVVLKPFALSRGMNYPVVSAADVEFPPPFDGISAFPTTVFIDRTGRIQEFLVGYRDYEALRRSATAADLGLGTKDAGGPP